jgi:hypothetical protein
MQTANTQTSFRKIYRFRQLNSRFKGIPNDFIFTIFGSFTKFNNTQTNSNLIGYTDFYFSVSVEFSDPYIIIIIIRVKVL